MISPRLKLPKVCIINPRLTGGGGGGYTSRIVAKGHKRTVLSAYNLAVPILCYLTITYKCRKCMHYDAHNVNGVLLRPLSRVVYNGFMYASRSHIHKNNYNLSDDRVQQQFTNFIIYFNCILGYSFDKKLRGCWESEEYSREHINL